MDEKTDHGAAGKLGPSSSVLPQDKGSKNKRKLDDPSLENPVYVPSSGTEFPLHELPPEIVQSPVLGALTAKSSGAPLKEDFELADWDDPIACEYEELLLSNLHTIFHNAIKKIVECGYKEDIAEKAISRRGLYQGGKDLVANVANDALASLKQGQEGDMSTHVFEDFRQLVEYTMLEMIGVLGEVKPSLSIVEAMWWLLVCDLNILVACEAEGDIFHSFGSTEIPSENSSNSNPQLRSETQIPETIPSSNEPNVSNHPYPGSRNHLPETLKFGSFPNLPNTKNSLAYERTISEKESLVSMGASGDYLPVASVSEEKSGTGRKGRSKKDLAALRQKSFNMEKYRGYVKGSFRAGKLSAAFSSFVVEKRMKSPSELPAVHMKKASSKMNAEARALPNESHRVFSISASGLILADNSSKLPTKGTKSTVPPANTENSPSSSLGKKSVSKSEGRTSVSSKTPDNDGEKKPTSKAESSSLVSSKMPDYYAGIPYDESLGKYMPQDEKDELILKLVPRLQELQNELHSWTQWANQKVMQAARRLSKDQPELKSLRQEKEEVEQLKKEKLVMEENTMKRLSEMEFALNNATSQVEDAHSTVQKLEREHSLLKQELEVATLQAAHAAASCQVSLLREQTAMKDAQSWDGQRSVLQEELASEKQKLVELQRKVGKAKNIYNQTEAASIRKEQERLEAAAKAEEDKIKQKAEKDMQKYVEEIKELENKLSELKLKLDSSKIAALRRGTGGVKGQCSSVNQGNEVTSFSTRVVDIKDYSGNRGLKQEHECVMCLSEEKITVFLPCAHQVLCVKCNELHEKQGMKDCPACRTPIKRRLCARFAKP
ncbi:Zinc finger, RING/FYVE/PHD-type [Corchorus olitorius]|uniref:Zinc finger, RING/FYVE/PHD-type n=1 Tax=Corchorus olitorius TaxID=93759 RepID=A0A1R3KD17_9ROSI|nr:Zinc finger, RING/FYVE/PHD-type [Corchorus olitorius]